MSIIGELLNIRVISYHQKRETTYSPSVELYIVKSLREVTGHLVQLDRYEDPKMYNWNRYFSNGLYAKYNEIGFIEYAKRPKDNRHRKISEGDIAFTFRKPGYILLQSHIDGKISYILYVEQEFFRQALPLKFNNISDFTYGNPTFLINAYLNKVRLMYKEHTRNSIPYQTSLKSMLKRKKSAIMKRYNHTVDSELLLINSSAVLSGEEKIGLKEQIIQLSNTSRNRALENAKVQTSIIIEAIFNYTDSPDKRQKLLSTFQYL